MDSQKPLWLILIVLAIGVGFYINDEVSSRPSKHDTIMENHRALMERMKSKGLIR